MTNITQKKIGSPLLVVAAALINAKNEILVQKRPEGKSMPGLWEFPGGKMEQGEGPAEALVRELYEELGIHIQSESLTPLAFVSEAISGRNLILLLFTAQHWEGEAAPLHASEIAWVTYDDLMTLKMPPADSPFISKLRPFLIKAKGHSQ